MSKPPKPPKTSVAKRRPVRLQRIDPPDPPQTKHTVIVHQHNWQWHIIARWFFAFVLSMTALLIANW